MRRLGTKSAHWKQAGDTIVEVLIAISIVSLVLTSAYMVTNKNSLVMQSTQEKTQAQKLIERQIELLRATDSVPNASFCFVDDGGNVTTDLAQCVFNQSGDVSSDTSSVQYKIAITPNTPSSDTFEIKAAWDRVGGGSSSITMNYYEKK